MNDSLMINPQEEKEKIISFLKKTFEEQQINHEEADQVLFLSLEKKLSLEEIEQQGFTNAKDILTWREKNLFKHNVPYVLK